MALTVVFMGTPDFAVPTLEAIVAAGHRVVACYTQPPRPAGRGMTLTPTPVHRRAEEMGIPVHNPTSLKGEEAAGAFRAHGADVAVVVAYGLLLPVSILEIPRFGCLNLHGSALPRWRGAAPIQRAIMAGDAETAVEVMQMEKGLDTGPVAMSAFTPIDPNETTGDLHDRLAALGAPLMVAALAALEDGSFRLTTQPEEGVTYAKKIDKAEARIDWTKPAQEIHDTLRGLSPFPGAWCEVTIRGKVERLKVLRSRVEAGSGAGLDVGAAAPGAVLDASGLIACGAGALRLVEVQRAGGKAQAGEVFARAVELAPGQRLA